MADAARPVRMGGGTVNSERMRMADADARPVETRMRLSQLHENQLGSRRVHTPLPVEGRSRGTPFAGGAERNR